MYNQFVESSHRSLFLSFEVVIYSKMKNKILKKSRLKKQLRLRKQQGGTKGSLCLEGEWVGWSEKGNSSAKTNQSKRKL